MSTIVEHLYEVGLEDRKTGERINLKVWATSTSSATHGLSKTLLGAYGPYRWTGTGPVYENNELVTRKRTV